MKTSFPLLAAALLGAIALPVLTLLFQPELLFPKPAPVVVRPYKAEFTSYSETAGWVAPMPSLTENVIELVSGFFQVGDFESVNRVLSKLPESEQKVLLTFGVNRQAASIRSEVQMRNSEALYDSSGVGFDSAKAVAPLIEFIETIKFPEVRARAYLDVAPLANDSKTVLRNSLESLEALPAAFDLQAPTKAPVLQSQSELYSYSSQQPAIAAAAPEASDSTSPPVKKSPLLWWLATLGGAIGVAVTYLAGKLVEVPIQNIGKSLVSKALASGGLEDIAKVVQDKALTKNEVNTQKEEGDVN